MTGVTPGVPARPLLHVQDQRANGTNGGALTPGAWRTRVLNTIVSDGIPGASLASNQVTLPAGDYEVLAVQALFGSHRSQVRLYDATGLAELMPGQCSYTSDSVGASRHPAVMGRFVLAVESAIELQVYTEISSGTFDAGAACPVAGIEVYADAMFWKVG